MQIRQMEPAEFPAARDVTVAAFEGDEHVGELLDGLRDSWAWRDDSAFVAVDGGEIVGLVLYTTALLDAPRRLVEVVVLGPIGVRPALQRAGVGSALITETVPVLDARGEPIVFLEGHPSYYPRFGFRPGGDLGFRKPSLRIPDDAFMALPLSSHEPWMTGTLVYPDVMWRVDAVGLRED